MSWRATAWAIGQITGKAGRKLLLLALANYADEDGICWPSQATLARDTEQSVDTVQRQIVVLEELTLLKRERMPKRRGQWQGYLYKLPLQTFAAPKVQTVARSPNLRSGQAAKSALTRPQSLRHKPSIEPSYEPSHKSIASIPAERIAAFQKKQEGTEVVQHRIAGRIGDDGWLVLGEMNEAQRSRLCTLERQGRLDDETLRIAVLAIRIEQRGNRN
ncbi:helix-turn-helix domain-containing protein [Bradyrhizobium erythrophlei]|uniref:Helix-turn-helix domain-containing protein n=1 Tax=Bradyrhizobium erythrophlei TaxID=1437360 RepID=A0A1M5SRK5_9BRAD|nr:helix-turn-helix domain-containing protein [Bradyrhizobium erythrophlei]SHH41080.1 Helix-turn-helix domain-containing protein [Bradyrhizobium erythrophlei]